MPHADVLDLTELVCPESPCPVAHQGTSRYQDGDHLAATFVRGLAGALGERLDLALGTGGTTASR